MAPSDTTTRSNSDTPTIALVLSGGGARGAYEAGVLSYLFEDLPARLGQPVRFDILTGTSVGAVHACYTGGMAAGPISVTRWRTWRSLTLDRVFPVGAVDLLRVPWRLLGFGSAPPPLPATHRTPGKLRGLFDTTWLESIVLDSIDWDSLRHNIDAGEVAALAVAATEIATGRSVVFVDSGTGDSRWPHDPFVVARGVEIGPTHALASAAIPLLFPAIRIGRTYYCDGGLRLNTPLAPALRLGADRVVVISLRHLRSAEEEDRVARHRETSFASPAYLMGKALNALLLDRIEEDLNQLHLFNTILEQGERTCGPDFVGHINEVMRTERGWHYRVVPGFRRQALARSRRDRGAVSERSAQPRVRDWLSHNVVRYLGRGIPIEADLLSYLFFDRCFTERLIDLGRRDAEHAAGAIAKFLSDPIPSHVRRG